MIPAICRPLVEEEEEEEEEEGEEKGGGGEEEGGGEGEKEGEEGERSVKVASIACQYIRTDDSRRKNNVPDLIPHGWVHTNLSLAVSVMSSFSLLYKNYLAHPRPVGEEESAAPHAAGEDGLMPLPSVEHRLQLEVAEEPPLNDLLVERELVG